MGGLLGRRDEAVLRDPALDRALHRDGFAVTRLIDAEDAAAMHREYEELRGPARPERQAHQPPDFEIALWADDVPYRQRLDELIGRYTDRAVESLLEHHRPIGRSAMVKWPALPDQEAWDGVPDTFHNDWSYVDERSGDRTYGIWLALQDVDERNGCVFVVPHSHRLDRTLRGWGVDSPWVRHHEVFEARAVPVTLRAGEAYVWDPALVHRSGVNSTGSPRVAASILTARPGSQLSLVRRRDDITAERVELGRDFFCSGDVAGIEGLPACEVLPLELADLSDREVARRLDRHARAHRVERLASRPWRSARPVGAGR